MPDKEGWITYIQRVVEAQSLVQSTDLVQLGRIQIPPGHVQILRQPALIVALGDDGHAPLRRPP